MAQLTVYSTIGVRSAAEGLFLQFEKASGHKLAVTWGTAPMLVKRICDGEVADVMILSRAGIDDLCKRGKIVPGSEKSLASSGVGIAIKAGSPKPDISTAEALKAALLKAKFISYTEPSAGGASGVYFAQLIERMGIADEMRPKTKYPPAGGFSAALLLTGEAELAVQQKPELLHIEGAEVVGLLPGELNVTTEFAAVAATDCRDAAAAASLIAMLCSADAKAAFRAKGLEPL